MSFFGHLLSLYCSVLIGVGLTGFAMVDVHRMYDAFR
jgi:hypothetical protein